MSELSTNDQNRLKALKTKIKNGLETAFDVGLSLMEIRDSKLYLQDYDTFEEFCNCEFNIEIRKAYRLIDASEVKESIKNVSHGTQIKNERQARELAKVPVNERESVLEEAAKDGPITAKKIQEAAKEKKVIHLDKIGRPIPESILEDWKRADEFSSVLRQLSDVKCIVDRALKDEDVVFVEIKNDSLALLKNAYGNLSCVIPHSVCPSCQGHQRSKCVFCKRRGFLSKFMYETCVPEETKAILVRGGAR